MPWNCTTPLRSTRRQETHVERFNTPAEAYEFKLGATLKMEHKVLEILEANIEAAQDVKVNELLRTHQSESQDHVRNVEEVFGLMRWAVASTRT